MLTNGVLMVRNFPICLASNESSHLTCDYAVIMLLLSLLS